MLQKEKSKNLLQRREKFIKLANSFKKVHKPSRKGKSHRNEALNLVFTSEFLQEYLSQLPLTFEDI